MNFFTSLRRVNKVYPNSNQFVNLDNINIINSSPSGFNNVFSAPTTVYAGNGRYIPGYNIGNNQFVSASNVNRVMRNNDVSGIRNIFNNVNNNQLDAVTQLRRMDNIPDANLHSQTLRKNAVKQNYPETMTRTPDGIQNVLNQNPNLLNRLVTWKNAGIAVVLGTGVVIAWKSATLIQDIIDAINQTGGSYYIRGSAGGDQYESCLLLHRTCTHSHISNPIETTVCDFDPLLLNDTEAMNQICSGFNYDVEKTVCRASDPTADVNSPQYVDISDLATGQTIACIEPYDFGDLIGDLGLDGLLGDNGLINKSSNQISSASEKLIPLLFVIGGILILLVVGYFVLKKMLNNTSITITQPTEPRNNKQ
ncbi:ODV-e56 [Euproctis pseudoconspersa nucleopolyhedrovirus]|uniref:ODV-e56 n=1 Tax=Euproctis pseudoconspersa nucleopolyhedrovirus TaxID=307467 RepID=C3TWR5_9ABAC|nr:ODV-e56 [Euproctis pseudoconspersa nucleopolyhedrovirus]ACO53457.1 ODV-e56 [Euproctis pseudoconspersa nucleopolyhedrovirus]QUJ09201.1 ODV-e56 protein [Gynaephora ruoergensis nucleopolyhedrovirus]